jgi:hypothetical protein
MCVCVRMCVCAVRDSKKTCKQVGHMHTCTNMSKPSVHICGPWNAHTHIKQTDVLKNGSLENCGGERSHTSKFQQDDGGFASAEVVNGLPVAGNLFGTCVVTYKCVAYTRHLFKGGFASAEVVNGPTVTHHT